MADEICWYTRRHDLKPGMIFKCQDSSIVMLDRGAPGDATRWKVLDWHNGWCDYDSEIEPGDLTGEPLDEKSINSN